MTQQPARAAIVGTGSIARAHVAAIEACGERVALVAAVEIDAERRAAFCARYGIPRAYEDMGEMLAAERPDLVHICTPPALHTPLSVQCLEAGAWVLCEKPLCASLAEVDAIEAAEQRTGTYCSSVFQWRFGSGAQHLRRLMASGDMGRPLVGICNTTWYRTMAYYGVPWHGQWGEAFGGPTMQLGIHAMDLFLWLLGDWSEVRAMAGTLDHQMEVEDVSTALVRFENEALGSIVNSAVSPRQETYLRFDFQKATVELKALYRYGNADWRYSIPEPAAHADDLAQWQTIPGEAPSSQGTQLAMLLDSRARNERPLVSGPEVRRSTEFATCLYKAAFTGQPVQRGSVTPDDPFYHHVAGKGPASGAP